MKRMNLVDLGRFRLENIPTPAPGKGEIRVRVSMVGVCGTDVSAFYGRHPYIHTPIVLGHEFSGTVDALGEGAKGPAAGTRVTALPHLGCMSCAACAEQRYNHCEALRCIGCQADGAHAEYVVVPDYTVFELPGSIGLEAGALVEPAAVGYHGIRRAMRKGDNVLVMGAGPIGLFALQAAAALGAGRLVIADVKPGRLKLAKEYADCGTINLSQETLSQGLGREAGGEKEIDLFCDCAGGTGKALDDCVAVARRGARISCVGIMRLDCAIPHMPDIVEHELTVYGSSMYVPQDYRDVIRLMSEGAIKMRGLVSHTYTLEDFPKLYDMLASGEDSMKIMIRVE